MKSTEVREKFIEFFKDRGHKVLPSASLVPENDPTVLFTTAGMHPLVPYFSGEKHPGGKRLTNSQKCIRTDDIDEVGDKIHHTFFEMLGNWSLGDYFKEETIKWSFEFLTSKSGLDLSVDRLAVSVFAGDNDAPFDAESFELWQKLGFKVEKIAKLPKKNNWWGPAGETGPCGPDTEMFVWTGKGPAPENFQETCENPDWVEIWNDVFMQYNKVKKDGGYTFEKLAQNNVDTGMGMERALALLNNTDDNYRTDLFWPLIEEIETISDKKYDTSDCHSEWSEESHSKQGQAQILRQAQDDTIQAFRVIADHIKAATFAIGDGVMPSNKGAGYIVRRLIRRAIVKAHELGINDNFTNKLADKVFRIYQDGYKFDFELVKSELEKEENKFRETLLRGLKKIEIMRGMKIGTQWSYGEIDWHDVKIFADDLFNLYQEDGVPLEVAIEEARRLKIPVAEKAFDQAEIMKRIEEDFATDTRKHQELSRTASAGKFKGGLADNKEETTRLHTAAHLLLAALRQVLSNDVNQKGSNITEERLRFDFNNPEKLTPEQISKIEQLVNDWIGQKLSVTMEELSVDEAKKSGATGVFDDRYGDKVKVYTIGDFSTGSTGSPQAGSGSRDTSVSREICGGPHVKNTSELGRFKITKEESSSSGIRRIKAVLQLIPHHLLSS